MFQAPKVDLPKPKVVKAVADLAVVSRVRSLEDHRVVVPRDLPGMNYGDVLALSNDIGSKLREVGAILRKKGKSLSAGARAQLEMAHEWLSAAEGAVEHEYHRRRSEGFGLDDRARATLADDTRYQVMVLGDQAPVKDVLSFASWLITGQLWHPNWTDAVRARMADYRRRLVAAMVAMIVPFNVEDPSPEAFNRLYREATGDDLFPTETNPPRTIRTEDDAIDSLAVTFLRPWLSAHGWIADLKRAARKANGQFARKPRANRTRKPARKARRASRSNPRYTLRRARRARRNPLVECSRPSKYVGAKMHWNGAEWTIDGCDSTVYEKSGGPGMFSAKKAGAKKRKPIAKRAVWEAAYRSRKSRSGAVKLPRRRSR